LRRDTCFDEHRFAIRKFQHIELDLRIPQRSKVTIQDCPESPLPVDRVEPYYMTDHLASSGYDFFVKYKNGL
jgi:hypothetical protein